MLGFSFVVVLAFVKITDAILGWIMLENHEIRLSVPWNSTKEFEYKDCVLYCTTAHEKLNALNFQLNNASQYTRFSSVWLDFFNEPLR